MTSASVADDPPIDTPVQAPPKYYSGAWWLVLVMFSGLTLNFQLSLITYRESLGVMIFLLAFVLLIVQSPHASVVAVLRWLPAATLGFLALASTLWSEAPVTTVRLSLMLLITIWSAVIVADRLTSRQFTSAFFLAFFIIVFGSLTSNRYQESTDGMALAGMSGSKNGLAYAAQIALFGGFAIGLDRLQPMAMRLMGWAAVPISLLVMVLAKSASAFALTAMGVAIFGLLYTFQVLRPQGRILALLAAVIIAAPVAINWPAITSYAENFQTQVLKKDKTLTGRTYLWERARPIISSRPIVGHGYSAFWREGALDAEGLWRWAGVRGGFNFHNDFIEMAVGLGYVGVALMIAQMAMIGVPILYRSVAEPSTVMGFFATMVTMMYTRTTVETGLISAWAPQTIMLFAAGCYALRRSQMPAYAPPLQSQAVSSPSSGPPSAP